MLTAWRPTFISTPKDDGIEPIVVRHPSADKNESELLHQAARGGFDPSSLTTLLGKKADMSTFLYETGRALAG